MNLDTLEKIYKQAPEVWCKGLCIDQCSCAPCVGVEHRVIAKKHGSVPSMMPNGKCDKLVDGKCSIYADRPLICRLWGVTEGMPCPHGCTPKKKISDHRAYQLLDAAERVK